MYPQEIEEERRRRPTLIQHDMIIKMVDHFYEKVKTHPTLGPIFKGVIGDHWSEHMPKMYKFWSSVLNSTGAYSGNPIRAHMSLSVKVDPENFGQWLGLFRETLEELFSPEETELIYEKAERIAQSLSLGMFYNPASVHSQNK